MGIKKILGSWRCFGKNPALATKILVNLVGVTVLRPFSPARMGYAKGLEMSKECIGDTRTLAIGAALFYSLAFAVAYLVISWTYMGVWI